MKYGKPTKSAMFMLISAVFFSLGGLFFKICPWDALAINSARCMIAAVCIYIFLRLRGYKFKVNRTVLIAALSASCTNNLYAAANKLTTAGNAIVLQFSMPAFVILIMLVLFGKRPTRLELLTCVLVLAGIVCFFIDSFTAGNMLGNALALISGMSYACYFIFSSREDSEPFSAILISYCLTVLIGLPWLLKTDIAGSSVPALLAVVGLGVLQQGGGQIFFALGIRDISPVAAGLISGIEPVLNPILVAVFYHELLTPISLLGAVIVLASVTVYNCLEAKCKT